MVWSNFSLFIIFCKDATKSALQIYVYLLGLMIKADIYLPLPVIKRGMGREMRDGGCVVLMGSPRVVSFTMQW